MSSSLRVGALVVIIALIVAVTAAYVAVEATGRTDNADEGGQLATVPKGPRIVFRNTTLDSTNGRVAVVPVADPGGRRALLDAVCDRVAADQHLMSCLSTERGMTSTFEQKLYDDGQVIRKWPLPGVPSRTRLSPSGHLVADTVFVAGHAYMQSGFSTQTVIRDVSGRSLGNLEDWRLYVDGRRYRDEDLNFWGVTFVDDHTFYATAASDGRTWLVHGNIDDRIMKSLHTNAECPSVSPDHTKVAYKKRTGNGAVHWSIAVLDLASGAETVLDESRNVDDQVTWLDDDTLLYGMPRQDTPGVTDIWQIDIHGGEPKVMVENAWSPSVLGERR